MMIELPYLPRLSETDSVSGRTQPWEFEPTEKITDEIRNVKSKRMNWANNHETEHCFFSGYLGLNPDGRISKSNENPAAQMLAIVVDYDGTQDLEKFKKQLDKYACPYYPNYISQSLGGGLHAVWVLEVATNVSDQMIEPLMKEISAQLKLPKLAKSFDKPALFDASKYYTTGDAWTKISDVPIPESVMAYWVKEALTAETLRLGSKASIDIPLDLAFEEAKRIYGAKMDDVLSFTPGMRCRRFWDDTATKPAGAFLMDNGFYCHAGHETFMDWETLLGPNFVAQYKVKQFDDMTENTWFNGKDYIYKNGADDRWTVQDAKNASLRFNVDFGINTAKKKGEASEMDHLLRDVQKMKGVTAFAHFVYKPEGIMEYQKEKYLNMSQIEAMKPSGRAGEWGELFPFMAEFFDRFCVSENEKHLLLAWWKRSYQGALEQKPKRGQIMLIAGPPSCGKTLFNLRMLAPSMGGGIDAAEHYINGSQGGFTDVLYKYGLHMVDDGEPGSRIGARKAMAARLKKTAATDSLSVNGKNKDLKQIEWMGRVCITMNDDPESLKATPELQETLTDKLIAIRARQPGDLLERTGEGTDQTIKEELPHMLQWLLDWTPPKEVLGETRYGIIPYCNLQLRREMESGGTDESFCERLDVYLTECQAASPDEEMAPLNIQTTVLLERMQACDLIKNGMRGMKNEHLGHILSRLQKRGFRITKRRSNKGQMWTIPVNFRPDDYNE